MPRLAGAYRHGRRRNGAELGSDLGTACMPARAQAQRLDQVFGANRREAEKTGHAPWVCGHAVDLLERQACLNYGFAYGIHRQEQRMSRQAHTDLRLADPRDIGVSGAHAGSFSNRGR